MSGGRLAGWRVLVPRDGVWGSDIAAALRAEGAEPVVAPLIRTVALQSAAVRAALRTLGDGGFDWAVVTSAAAAPVLARTSVAPRTRVAAVGPATASALDGVGIRTDFVPSEHSAGGLLAEWPESPAAQRVLLLQSDLASPEVSSGLQARGHHVTRVVAYRTVGVDLDLTLQAAVSVPGPWAALVTSGSVARSLVAQAANLPDGLVIACLGPRTAQSAQAAGLSVALVAPERSAAALVDALAEHAAQMRTS